MATGFGVYRWSEAGWDRVPPPVAAVRLAVNSAGRPWLINGQGEIYAPQGRGWVQVPGLALDIGVGADGSVWVIGTDRVPGGFGVYRWTGREWERMAGVTAAVGLSVNHAGWPWMINASNEIFAPNGGQWAHVAGSALDVGVGSRGAVWIVGTDLAIPSTSGGDVVSENWLIGSAVFNASGGRIYTKNEDDEGIQSHESPGFRLRAEGYELNGRVWKVPDGNVCIVTDDREPICAGTGTASDRFKPRDVTNDHNFERDHPDWGGLFDRAREHQRDRVHRPDRP